MNERELGQMWGDMPRADMRCVTEATEESLICEQEWRNLRERGMVRTLPSSLREMRFFKSYHLFEVKISVGCSVILSRVVFPFTAVVPCIPFFGSASVCVNGMCQWKM